MVVSRYRGHMGIFWVFSLALFAINIANIIIAAIALTHNPCDLTFIFIIISLCGSVILIFGIFSIYYLGPGGFLTFLIILVAAIIGAIIENGVGYCGGSNLFHISMILDWVSFAIMMIFYLTGVKNQGSIIT